MQEGNFRIWLYDKEYSKKVISDIISRLKKIERLTSENDLDKQWDEDNFKYLLSIFKNKGLNEQMELLKTSDLPIGKYNLSTYKYSLNLYSRYKKSKSDRS